MDLLRCWVSEKLNLIPTECIIYCGLQDILDKSAPDKILDNLSSLISDLKERNRNMNIYICQLPPTLLSQDIQAKIGDFNEHLRLCCESNDISIIKTDPTFRLGTGEIDDMCYNMEGSSPGRTLNRLGIIRLFSTITKHCPHMNICKNITKLKTTQSATPKYTSYLNQHYRNKDQEHYSGNRTINNSNRANHTENHPPDTWARVVGRNSTHTPAGHTFTSPRDKQMTHSNTLNRQQYIPISNRFSRLDSTHDFSHKRDNQLEIRREQHDRTHRPTDYTPTTPWREPYDAHSYPQAQQHDIPTQNRYEGQHLSNENENNFRRVSQHYSTRRHNEKYIKKVGCYNCEEYNHRQSSCRFDHKLQCSNCLSLGHKSRLCRFYST